MRCLCKYNPVLKKKGFYTQQRYSILYTSGYIVETLAQCSLSTQRQHIYHAIRIAVHTWRRIYRDDAAINIYNVIIKKEKSQSSSSFFFLFLPLLSRELAPSIDQHTHSRRHTVWHSGILLNIDFRAEDLCISWSPWWIHQPDQLCAPISFEWQIQGNLYSSTVVGSRRLNPIEHADICIYKKKSDFEI